MHGKQIDKTISIHAPHEGERPVVSRIYAVGIHISIHAPHEGERPMGDKAKVQDLLTISIHAPHEGERRRLADI